MVCSHGPDTHDAIVGESQKENVLLLEAKGGWNNDYDDHVEQEDDLGVAAKIDDAQGKRTRSEDQAGKVGGQNLDNLQLFLSLFNPVWLCPGCKRHRFCVCFFVVIVFYVSS